MFEEIARLLGIVGLLLITWGIFAKSEKQQDWIFVAGGACLLLYSIYLQDLIFIILQTVFILASLYEIHKLKRKTVIRN